MPWLVSRVAILPFYFMPNALAPQALLLIYPVLLMTNLSTSLLLREWDGDGVGEGIGTKESDFETAVNSCSR